MRGKVLTLGPDGDGIVSGADDARYRFHARDVRFMIQVGDTVDFLPVDDTATEIILMAASPNPIGSGYHLRSDRTEVARSPWGYFMKCLEKFIDGQGRASRREFWWFVFFRWVLVGGFFLAGAGLQQVFDPYDTQLLDPGTLLAVVGVGIYVLTILPNFCATIRRLHDVGLSGWLVLINVIPYVGMFILFVISVMPSQARKNDHGAPPVSAKPAVAL